MNGLKYFCIVYKCELETVAKVLRVKPSTINSWKSRQGEIPKKHLPKLQELFSVPDDKVYLIEAKYLRDIDHVEIMLLQKKSCLENSIIDGYIDIIPLVMWEIENFQRQINQLKVVEELNRELNSSILKHPMTFEFEKKLSLVKVLTEEIRALN